MTYFTADSFPFMGLVKGVEIMSPPPSSFSGKNRAWCEVRYIVRENT